MNDVKFDAKFTLQTDNKITTNSRVWLRDGLQIHYAGVRISLRSTIWAISVTRIASGLSKPGVGVRFPHCLPYVKVDMNTSLQSDNMNGASEKKVSTNEIENERR